MNTLNFKQVDNDFKTGKIRRAFQKLELLFDLDTPKAIAWVVGSRNQYACYQNFWESNIPKKHFYALFSSEVGLDYLSRYFFQFYVHFTRVNGKSRRQKRKCHPIPIDVSLLQQLSEKFPKLLLNAIKLNEAFLKDAHFESFNFFQYHPSQAIKDFYTVILKLKNDKDLLEREISKYDKKLKAIPIHELLVHLALVIEKKKFDYYHNDEPIGEFRIEYYGHPLSSILNRKKRLGIQVLPKKEEADLYHLDAFEMMKKKIDLPKNNEWIEQLFELCTTQFLFDQDLLQTFCFDQNYKAIVRTDNVIEFESIDEKRLWRWKKNGEKYKLWHGYYFKWGYSITCEYEKTGSLIIPGDDERHKDMNRTNHANCIANEMRLADYCIGSEIETRSGKLIDRTLLLEMLNVFSINCKDRYEREIDELFITNKNGNYIELMMKAFDNTMKKHNVLDSPVRVYHIDNFAALSKRTLTQRFKNVAEVKNYLEFVSHDLLNSRSKLCVFSSPFLKIGDYLLVFPAFFAAQDFFTVVANNLLSNSNKKHQSQNRKKETDEMDENLAKLFRIHDFKAEPGFCAVKRGKTITDIDLLAYKDKTLFVLQNKSTYVRSSQREAYLHEQGALQKAADQLDKSILFIKNNFTEIQDLLEIQATQEEVKIYPLIVSTCFERDYELFNGYKKISLLELKVILRNEKSMLYFDLKSARDFLATQKDNPCARMFISGINNGELVSNWMNENMKGNEEQLIKEFKENFLYEGKVNANRIIEIIEKDEVWSFLDPAIELPPENGRIFIPLENCSTEQHMKAYNKGEDFYNAGKFTEALEQYQKAIRLYPDDADYFKGSGNAKAMLGKTKESLPDFNKAIELNPNFDRAYNDRALSFFELGRYYEALGDIEKAIEFQPTSAEFLFNKGQIMMGLKQYFKAREIFQKGLELGKGSRFEAPNRRQLNQLNSFLGW